MPSVLLLPSIAAGSVFQRLKFVIAVVRTQVRRATILLVTPLTVISESALALAIAPW
jgi:hypothetical protein